MTFIINVNGRFDASGPEGLRNLAGGNAPGSHAITTRAPEECWNP